MNRKLEEKNALVTGARKGIGRQIVETFAENGANIWACSHTHSEEFVKEMKDLGEKYSVNIWPVFFDLGNSADISYAMREVIAEGREVNIVVNNAGITYRALFQMTPLKTAKEVFDIDFFGPYQMLQLLTKRMVKNNNGSSIINIISTAGLDANAGRAAYGSAKAALLCLTRIIAEEFGEKGIRSNAVAPGITRTEMLTYTEEMLEELLDESLLKKIGQPEDVANAVLFLASDDASYITGQVIRVDGGLLL